MSTVNHGFRPGSPSLRRVAGHEVMFGAQRDHENAACATAVADDRARMAKDLYDAVIHRLFAAGLQLQATCQLVPEAEQLRLETTIDLLDITITELRKAIFSLH
jgi:signal transduction histidine kinase